MGDRLGPFLRGAEVLSRSVVGLEAGKGQIGGGVDHFGQFGGRLAGVDPAAVAAQVDLDQDRQIYPGLNGGGRVGGDLVRVVGQDGDVGRLGQGAEAAQFLSPDDLVGYPGCS